MTRFTILFFLTAHLLYAQPKISGTILTTSQKPLEGAVVSLLKAKDSTFVKAAVSESNGQFELLNIKPETFSRALAKLEPYGVNAEGRNIVITDMAQLVEFCDLSPQEMPC